MSEFYRDEWLTILQGDVREVLPTLPAESVDCIVTSPPYWGLRDYGNDGQIGLERTPEEYVANLVGVFRELRRVLKASGTCWLNLGDSYTRAQTGNVPQTKWKAVEFPEHSKAGASDGAVGRSERPGSRAGGLKDKDLVGIPWRVAFALQADGWYLRSDIVWNKLNPMPESVTDRPTKSHEYIFLLTKRPTYYFDAEAVREGVAEATVSRLAQDVGSQSGSTRQPGKTNGPMRAVGNTTGRNIRSVWSIATTPYGSTGAGPGDTAGTTSPDCPVHSLPAIRRRLRTGSDDELRDHLRSRSRSNGASPAPMPTDGLFSTLDLDRQGPNPSMPDSALAGSSPAPTPGSAGASRTTSLLSGGDGLGSDEGTESHTSRSSSLSMQQGDAAPFGSDADAATHRSERESRTIDGSVRPDLEEPQRAHRTPDIADQSERVCSCPNNSASHFAVFPPELPERCIKAGSSERGVCPECGAPWERVVERIGGPPSGDRKREGFGGTMKQAHATGTVDGSALSNIYREYGYAENRTTGWKAVCACDAANFDANRPYPAAMPAVVLDPFAGSGTTGVVANRLSRRAILIDLNGDYLKQQLQRNAQTPLGLGAA